MMMVVDHLLALQRPSLVPRDGVEHLRTRKILALECPCAAGGTALRSRRRRGCAGAEIVGKVCREGFEPPAGTHRAPLISKDKKISHTRLTPPRSRPAAAQPSRSRAIAMIKAAQTRCPVPSKGSATAPRRATRHRCTQPIVGRRKKTLAAQWRTAFCLPQLDLYPRIGNVDLGALVLEKLLIA